MRLERTFQGLEAEVRVAGPSRIGSVTFLLVWLAIWAVGELLVAMLLVWGGWALFTGQPPAQGREPLATGPALLAGVFLALWLAFWTLGGILAGQELLRQLFGRVALLARPDQLEIRRSYGVYRTRETLSRERLLRFFLPRSGLALAVETADGIVELARTGRGEDLAQLASALNAEYGLSSVSPAAGSLPEGWRELATPEGTTVIARDPAIRRRQAMVAWILALPVIAVAAYLLATAGRDPGQLVPGLIVGAVAGLLGWGASRLSWCRDEWVIERGLLVLQRRRHGHATRRFEATGLRLMETTDGDGDAWFKLLALDAATPADTPDSMLRRHARTVAAQSADPTELQSFGRWLARRCQIPFEDRTTAEGRAMDHAQLRGQLAASGRFGRWAAKWLERFGPKPGSRT